jgi:hypothetical protein
MSDGVPRVFIDTEVFVRNNFDYAGPRLDSLRKLGATGNCSTVRYRLTVREIEANLDLQIESAVTSLRPAAIFRNSALPKIKNRLSRLTLDRSRRNRGRNCAVLEGCEGDDVESPADVLPTVLDSYFNKKAPLVSARTRRSSRRVGARNAAPLLRGRGFDIAVVSSDQGIKRRARTKTTFISSTICLRIWTPFLLQRRRSSSLFTARSQRCVRRSSRKQEALPERGAVLVNQDGRWRN